MRRSNLVILAAFLAGFALAAVVRPLPASGEEGGSALTVAPPDGYLDLITRAPQLAYPDDPAAGRQIAGIDLALLRQVNAAVNVEPYRPDPAGRDIWGRGSDCEDYALRKLVWLLELGAPRGALRLAVAKMLGKGHAVLVVRVAPGRHLVLDSLLPDVVEASRYPGILIAGEAPGGWRRVVQRAELADLVPSPGQLAAGGAP